MTGEIKGCCWLYWDRSFLLGHFMSQPSCCQKKALKYLMPSFELRQEDSPVWLLVENESTFQYE